MTTAKAKAPQRRAGQVLTWDSQSDVYEGQYTLVERTGPNRWLAVRLPPSETEILDIQTDPWQTDPDAAIARRWESWGIPFPVCFSRDYHKHF